MIYPPQGAVSWDTSFLAKSTLELLSIATASASRLQTHVPINHRIMDSIWRAVLAYPEHSVALQSLAVGTEAAYPAHCAAGLGLAVGIEAACPEEAYPEPAASHQRCHIEAEC